MCGIAGYVGNVSYDSQLIKKMTDTMVHRGPDGEGHWRGKFASKELAVGHRRLSIFDLSENGAQPMFSKDRSIVMNMQKIVLRSYWN